jgi:hypothetical protein
LPFAARHDTFVRIDREEDDVIAPAILVVALALLEAGTPFVYEVPPGGASLESQRRPLFYAAAFTVREGRVVRGEWMPSDEVLGQRPTRVVVVASWCPACHRLLERLSARRPQTTVILFLERRSGDDPLADAASLARYPLAFHLLRDGSEMARRVTVFPTTFVCSRKQCTPETRNGPERR